jgi:large subunit ribosomal protein L21
MIAVIDDSASQFKVAEGDTIEVDLREIEVGSTLSFDKITLVEGESGIKIGTPYVDGAVVTGTVLAEKKGRKVIATHFRRRKDSKTRAGHRQKYLQVKIDKIQG